MAPYICELNRIGGNGGGSFKVKYGSDAAEVRDVHEARAGEVEEREMRIKSNTKIADRGIRTTYSLTISPGQ